jgi:hypothetical protein
MRAPVLALFLCALTPTVFAQRRHASQVPPPPPCKSGVLATAASAALVTDDFYVYYGDWTTYGIYRVPKSGGTPEQLARFPSHVATKMAVDDDNVYAAVRPHGDAITTEESKFLYTIYAIPKRGGQPKTLAENVWLPQQIAGDGTFVYWISLGSVVHDPVFAADGKIERIRKDGSDRQVLAGNLSGPTSMALDATSLFFTETGLGLGNRSAGVRRMPKSGGAIQELFSSEVDVLALDGDALFMLTENYDNFTIEIQRMAKSGGLPDRIIIDQLGVPSQMIVFAGRVYYATVSPSSGLVVSTDTSGSGRLVQYSGSVGGDFAVDNCALYVNSDQKISKIVR